MARTTVEEAGSSVHKNRAGSLPPGKEKNQNDSNFGKDPWEYVNFDAAAIPTAFTSNESTERTSQPALKIQLISHFKDDRKEDSKATPAPPTKAPVAPEQGGDDVAIPTPIGEVVACKLVPTADRDGRVEYIYQPIAGFEHLLKAPASTISQKPPSKGPTSRNASDTLRPADQARVPGATKFVHHQPHTTGATNINATSDGHPHSSFGGSQYRRSRHVRQPIVSPMVKPEPQHVTKKTPALKRTRSVAQGLSRSRSVREASDIENNDDEYGEERFVKTEESKTFHVGDIEQLMIFFRNRIDELTMKPVRSMLTAWVKQLEPKRKGLHGPYHKMLPAEAPEDTPPWWPRTVPYSEPAHLDKDGLLTLAVDILLQHRMMPVDEFKREMNWTRKLRRIAELEVEMTPSEAYSSSRNLDFSTAMKKRAEEEILPSLFDVSQSYEDHVNQYELWKYKDITKAPKGKSITWHFIPKPPKAPGVRIKRQRPAERKRAQPKQPVVGESRENSGDETEPDNRMFEIATRLLDLHEAKEARRVARAAAKQVVARGEISRERTRAPPGAPAFAFQPSLSPPPSPSLSLSPAPVKKKAKLAKPKTQPEIDANQADTGTTSSFDGSITRLSIQEHSSSADTTMLDTQADHDRPDTPAPVKRVQNPNHQISDVSAVVPEDSTDAKGGSLMESRQEVHHTSPDTQVLDSPMRYGSDLQLADDENDAKGGSLFSSDAGAQFYYNNNLGFNPQHAGYANALAAFSMPPSRPSTNMTPSSSSFPNSNSHGHVNPPQLSMLNGMFPNHMDQLCFVANASLNNMDLDYSYATDTLFNNTDVDSSAASPQASTSFNGLSYGFTGSQGY